MIEFHFKGVTLKDGIPQISISYKTPYSSGENPADFDIEELKAGILELTRALHIAEMVKEHSASCVSCTIKAISTKPAGGQ